ncbi:MAG: radical SAM protein [Spirochaetaceae bacterium]|nr:radical SAM protein [Spirochaetaceae bacterium]
MESTLQVKKCLDCPRQCGGGFCGDNSQLRLAWAGLHFGEEPLLVKDSGSGTIFVSGCNLRCSFCQNFQISQQGLGRDVSQDEFVQICLGLQNLGAKNINIVTGSHVWRILNRFLADAKSRGLQIPVCWNSSAYETVEMVEALSENVSVFLPDLKTLNPLMSKELFQAENYPRFAKRAISAMVDASPLRVENGEILSGVIVRHLFLPGRFEDTRAVLEWFAQNLNGRALLSLMTQYTPVAEISAFQNRFVAEEEGEKLKNLLEELGIEDGFFQELNPDSEWLPDFTRKSPFANNLAKSLWHYSQ